MSHWAFILYILLPPQAGFCLGMGLSFFNPTLTLFVVQLTLLLCHLIVFAMLLFDLCLLGLIWACFTLSFCSVIVAQYYRWACTHAVLGFLGPFYSFGHPWHVLFPRASLAHSNPSSPQAFAKSFGLLQPKVPYPLLSGFIGFPTNPICLVSSFGLLRPIFAYFPFVIMPMGLLVLSLGSFKPACFF